MNAAQGAVAQFGCNTYAYMMAEPAETCTMRLADKGFVEFEYMVHPGHLWPADMPAGKRASLRGLFERCGLELATLNLPNIDLNIASTVPEMRRYSVDMIAEIVTLAGDLGARGVIMSPGRASTLFPPPEEELFGYFFAALDRLTVVGAKSGVKLWIENVPTTWIPAIDGLMAALKRYGNDDVRIIYDIANAHFIAEDFAAGLMLCRDRLEMVHLSDTNRKIFRHDAVGHGTVPFADVPRALKVCGYTKRPMLEIISRDADSDIMTSVEKLAGMGFAPRP